MSDQIYYLIPLFIVILLGWVTGLSVTILALLYYPVTRIILIRSNKSTKKLDDFYLILPRLFGKIGDLVKFVVNWLIMPPINFITWIPRTILKIVRFLIKVFSYLLVNVPKYLLKLFTDVVYNLIIAPIKWLTNYYIKLTDWFASGDASDYFSMVIVNFYEFYFFQWQEILNTIIKNSFSVFKIPPIKSIKLDESAFILKDFF